ncbi:MAG: hypothetical protein ACYSW8_30595 [Planctomycetota bacterium]|jgi:hypothetical protein
MARKNDGKESEHLPTSITEFIGQLMKKMRYRRKVREEVKAELAAHFADELRGCGEDQHKQEKASQLIAEFGDLKMLAALLRRAKRRCRPLWRTVAARTFQALGILLLCFIVYVGWFFSGKPVISTDYVAELNRIVRPTADDSHNAAPFYDEAAELYRHLSDEFLLYFAQNHQVIADIEDGSALQRLSGTAERVSEVLASPEDREFQEYRQDIQDTVQKMVSRFVARKDYNELTLAQISFVERWVTEHSDALELIVEGSRLPHCWREYQANDQVPSAVINVRLPDLSEFRELSRALRCRALLSAEQGRYEGAFDDVQSLYRFGRHTRMNKLLIEQIAGIVLEAMAVKTAREIVGGYEVGSEIMEDFQRNLELIVADEDFSICVEAEKLALYDEIQRSFTSGGIGKGHLYLPRFREVSIIRSNYTPATSFESLFLDMKGYGPYLFTHPNKQETLDTADALYEYYDQLISKTAAQRRAEAACIERKLRAFAKSNKLLHDMAPPVLRLVEISNRLPMDVSATLAILAISRYKADNGRYPQDLNELLTQGYLKELPIDTFTDKPLVYRAEGADFILYSFGLNFIDDGGVSSTNSKGRPKQWADNGDTVFWPLPEQ